MTSIDINMNWSPNITWESKYYLIKSKYVFYKLLNFFPSHFLRWKYLTRALSFASF